MLARTQHGSARWYAAGLLLLFFCGLCTAGIASAGAQHLVATGPASSCLLAVKGAAELTHLSMYGTCKMAD